MRKAQQPACNVRSGRLLVFQEEVEVLYTMVSISFLCSSMEFPYFCSSTSTKCYHMTDTLVRTMLSFFTKRSESWFKMEKTRSRISDALQTRKSLGTWFSCTRPVSRRPSESIVLSGSAYGRLSIDERPPTAGSLNTTSESEGGTNIYPRRMNRLTI